MIINEGGAIRPHRYVDRDFRRFMGDHIGKATQDDLLAALVLAEEATVARNIVVALAKHVERVSREQAEAITRRNATLGDTPKSIADACRAAAGIMVEKLTDELLEAQQALEEGRAAFMAMRKNFGMPAKFLHEQAAKDTAPTHFETMMPLWRQYGAADDRLDALLEADIEELHRVARLDAHRIAFIRSEASMSLAQIDALHHSEFEQLAADLVRRDGYHVRRSGGGAGDLGADVIAVGPDGATVVIQCKHRTNGAAIGSPDLQRLNGTARQVHGADIVVAMTNVLFSLPARRFAEDQRIHLVEATQLERWATWGQPLAEVLELSTTG